MKTYFISDIHLGALYINDSRAHETRVCRMLEAFGKDASHIYLLGDVLDYWFEYKTVVPRGYVRFFGTLARLVDKGVKITWIVGNHDIWLFDYLRDEIGIEVIDGNIVRQIDGKLFFLAHGDGLGNLKRSFRFIRSVFRNRFCQVLYAGIHPRWTVPFAHRWSSGSRNKNVAEYPDWRGDDNEPSFVFARQFTSDIRPDLDYFITGHRHLLVDKMLPSGCRFVILGECYQQFVYAVWDGEKLEINHFDGKAP